MGVSSDALTAHVDFAFNQYHGSRWGMFGFLEFEEDPEILDALLAAAEGGYAPTAAIAWWARWTSSSTTSPG